jgi:hypothetical protein
MKKWVAPMSAAVVACVVVVVLSVVAAQVGFAIAWGGSTWVAVSAMGAIVGLPSVPLAFVVARLMRRSGAGARAAVTTGTIAPALVPVLGGMYFVISIAAASLRDWQEVEALIAFGVMMVAMVALAVLGAWLGARRARGTEDDPTGNEPAAVEAQAG